MEKGERDCPGVRERDGRKEGDLDGRERQRRRGSCAEAGDRETRMRDIRLGRGDKGERGKRSVKRARPREMERRGSNPRGFGETAPSKGGRGG